MPQCAKSLHPLQQSTGDAALGDAQHHPWLCRVEILDAPTGWRFDPLNGYRRQLHLLHNQVLLKKSGSLPGQRWGNGIGHFATLWYVTNCDLHMVRNQANLGVIADIVLCSERC